MQCVKRPRVLFDLVFVEADLYASFACGFEKVQFMLNYDIESRIYLSELWNFGMIEYY